MLKVPCKRENTEWVETVETGWNVLADLKPQSLRSSYEAY
jgi:UDP-N-acetylglucosamine 2-epimerase